jgi:hypothetical protein
MARSLRELTGSTGSIPSNFDSLVPDLSDTADITEAFRAYHFGVSSWTPSSGTPLGIVGALQYFENRVDSIDNTLFGLPVTNTLLTKSGPNPIISSSASVVPITITATSNQTANLLEIKNSAGVVISNFDSLGRLDSEIINSTLQNSYVVPGQSLSSFLLRNIVISSSNPTGGNDGDIWIKY